MNSAEDNLTPDQRAALDKNERLLNGEDEFAPTDEERARWSASDAQAMGAGARHWARIFDNHLEMRKLYAYVKADGTIVELRDPMQSYTWRDFCNQTAGSTRLMIGPRGGERQVLVAKDWLEDQERLTVDTRTFQPNAPRITQNLVGQSAINIWSPPAIASVSLPDDWEQRAEIFPRHLAYLIPDITEHAMVLRWLAHIVQRPEELPGWHPLLIAENTFGTGRNFVSHAVACMLPEYTVEDLPLKRLLEGKHNSEIERAILGVVDEIHEGGKGQWDKEQELRSFLSAKKRTINPKHLKPFEIRNFLRVLMFSNHADALPLPEADRRHYVVRCTTTPRAKGYYDAIYTSLKDRATLRSIYERLRLVDLAGFDIAGRAPTSLAKTEMIVAARSDEESELRRIVKDWGNEIIRRDHMWTMLQRFRDSDLLWPQDRNRSDQLNERFFKQLLRKCGLKSIPGVQVRRATSGADRHKGKSRVLVLKDYEKWEKVKTEDELRIALEPSDKKFLEWCKEHDVAAPGDSANKAAGRPGYLHGVP